MQKNYFYKFNSQNLPETIDQITIKDGIEYGAWSGQSRADLESTYGPLKTAPTDELLSITNAAYITAPVVITERQFIDALECLPPVQWRRIGGVESFRMSERYTADITTIYAKVGDNFCSFKDHIGMTFDALNKKVLDFMKTLPADVAQPG